MLAAGESGYVSINIDQILSMKLAETFTVEGLAPNVVEAHNIAWRALENVQGSDVSFAAETPLRYDSAAAERRPQDSDAAKEEAFRRAVKLERACSTTSADTVFEMGEVKLLRWRPVSARKARN